MKTVATAYASPAECPLASQARGLGAAGWAIAISAIEAWLRVPIQPMFDGHLQAAVRQVASLAHALRKLSI